MPELAVDNQSHSPEVLSKEVFSARNSADHQEVAALRLRFLSTEDPNTVVMIHELAIIAGTHLSDAGKIGFVKSDLFSHPLNSGLSRDDFEELFRIALQYGIFEKISHLDHEVQLSTYGRHIAKSSHPPKGTPAHHAELSSQDCLNSGLSDSVPAHQKLSERKKRLFTR